MKKKSVKASVVCVLVLAPLCQREVQTPFCCAVASSTFRWFFFFGKLCPFFFSGNLASCVRVKSQIATSLFFSCPDANFRCISTTKKEKVGKGVWVEIEREKGGTISASFNPSAVFFVPSLSALCDRRGKTCV